MANTTYKVYKLVNEKGKIFYIGYTSQSLQRRFNQHLNNLGKRTIIEKERLGIRLVKEFKHRELAIAEEKYLINLIKPQMNVLLLMTTEEKLKKALQDNKNIIKKLKAIVAKK